MSAANHESEEGFEKLLDELTGPVPDDDTEDVAEPESEPEPIAAEAEDDDEDDDEEPGNLRLEATPEAEEEPEAEPEPVIELSDAERRLAEQEKKNNGLEAELRKLRAERRQNALQNSRQDAPAPTREFVPVAPTVPEMPRDDHNRIPVVVSEDGQSVYVDDAKLQVRTAEIARSELARANQPTPDQIRAHQTQRLAQSFIGSNPETQAERQAIFIAAQKADDYISMKLTAEANRQGVRFEGLEQMQMFMRETGIGAEVEQFFPEIAPMVEEFVAAYASDIPGWKRSVLDRIAANQSSTPAPSGASTSVQRLSATPESLSRKGGTRSASPSTEESEFIKLESAFRKDMFGFPDDKYKRLEALGKKLDKSGF